MTKVNTSRFRGIAMAQVAAVIGGRSAARIGRFSVLALTLLVPSAHAAVNALDQVDPLDSPSWKEMHRYVLGQGVYRRMRGRHQERKCENAECADARRATASDHGCDLRHCDATKTGCVYFSHDHLSPSPGFFALSSAAM
ncbi:MAG: hypothetical protein AAGA95_12035, partial [Pseudomonadota bacterium]